MMTSKSKIQLQSVEKWNFNLQLKLKSREVLIDSIPPFGVANFLTIDNSRSTEENSLGFSVLPSFYVCPFCEIKFLKQTIIPFQSNTIAKLRS